MAPISESEKRIKNVPARCALRIASHSARSMKPTMARSFQWLTQSLFFINAIAESNHCQKVNARAGMFSRLNILQLTNESAVHA